MIRLIVAIALALATAIAQGQAGALAPGHTGVRFSFAVIGDTPYSFGEEWMFADMLKDIDREDLAFVVHIGDFKSGTSPCSDELFAHRLQQFQSVRHPFIFVPGDNEWTDCHRSGADPLERLAKLREMFYPDDDSLGQRKLKLERQSADPRFAEYRENVRWTVGSALFIGLNIPGSNNNLGRTSQMDAEYARRSEANAAWLAEGFDLARNNDHAAVFVAIQADPRFEPSFRHPANVADGYAQFRQELLAHTLAWGNPVILVHGDTHRYRVDQPLVDPATQKPVERFTRIESFGSPTVDWIRVTVNPADPKLLAIKTGREINPPR
ncbi:MAG: metallophosphoesterase family protein [Pseudomonadota bacterium]